MFLNSLNVIRERFLRFFNLKGYLCRLLILGWLLIVLLGFDIIVRRLSSSVKDL